MRLKDRAAIVTGAARGIGQAYALALAREGAKVVAADILSCADTIAEIQEAGGEAVGMAVDVADFQSTHAMTAQTVQRFKQIDILVNNAAVYGGLKRTPFEQIPEAEWDRVMAVNVKGLWLCSKAVIPTMKQQGYGKIINISSDTIWMGVPLFLHYVASKGAVFAFTRALARELSGTGITVNTITPGYTMTEAAQGLADPETVSRLRAWVVDQQIIKRHEEPSDLAGTVVFLASEDSDFITGQTINVNGGATHH
jgi:NAD(P)-dependent dehydrogenase (short-subunit alcohol dehydrogenase family)